MAAHEPMMSPSLVGASTRRKFLKMLDQMKEAARKLPKDVNWSVSTLRGTDVYCGGNYPDYRPSGRMTITIEIEGGAQDVYFDTPGGESSG